MVTYQVWDNENNTWLPEKGTTHLGSIISALTIPGTRLRIKDEKSGNRELSEIEILNDIFRKEEAAIRSDHEAGVHDQEGLRLRMRDLWADWAEFRIWKDKEAKAES